MTTVEIQTWVGIVGTLVTVGASVLGVLHFQRGRDKAAAVGAEFKDVVNSLASDNETSRMAGAILLRRFFDIHSEQGAAHLSYAKEAVAVIAGLLREMEPGAIQKVLADGLRYAPSLAGLDLQGCTLTGAFLGTRDGDPTIVDLTSADLFRAKLTAASLKGVKAPGAVFAEATLVGTVLIGADLRGANFRGANLDGAKFDDANLDGAKFDDAHYEGARFDGAFAIPPDVASKIEARTASLAGESDRDG